MRRSLTDDTEHMRVSLVARLADERCAIEGESNGGGGEDKTHRRSVVRSVGQLK